MRAATASPTKEEPASSKIFLSYSRKDRDFVDRLAAAIGDNGLTPLIDRSDIYALEDWWARVEELIVQADVFAFVISPDSLSSEICLRELALAQSLNKQLAPIVWRRVGDMPVPDALARLNFVFFDTGDVGRNTACLAEALSTNIGWVRKHTELGGLARRWELSRSLRRGGLLLRPPILEEAERWIASRPRGAPLPTASTQLYIAESRKAANWRRTSLIVVLAGGLAVALALSVVAMQQRSLAQRNFEAAHKTVDGVVFNLALELRDVEGLRSESVRQILDRAAEAYRTLASATDNDPEVRSSQVGMYVSFAETYAVQGDLARQVDAAETAYNVARDLVIEDPDNRRFRRQRAIAAIAVGDAWLARKNFDSALRVYLDALKTYQELAADEKRNKALIQRDVVTAYVRLGDTHKAKGDNAEALRAYRGALAIAEELARLAPDSDEAQQDLSVAHLSISGVLASMGDDAGALEQARRGAAVAERMRRLHPTNSRWQTIVSVQNRNVGDRLAAAARYEEARASYRSGLEAARAVARTDPRNVRWQLAVATLYGRLGDTEEKLDNPEAALAAYGGRLAALRELEKIDPGHEQWLGFQAVTLQKMGDLLVGHDDASEALQYFERCLAIRERLADTAQRDLVRQFALIDAERRMAQHGDRRLERWSRIVDRMKRLGERPELTAAQRAWIAENLPLYEAELGKLR